MNWRSGEFLGERIVAQVHDALRADSRYVLDQGNGFTYWSGNFATRVKSDEGLFRQSIVIYRVTAETDFLRGRGHMRDLVLALEHEMDQATFSAPVYDNEKDTFMLSCGIYATEDNAQWLIDAFATAVRLQIAEAYALAESLGQKFHASPALSGHPQAGLRDTTDQGLHDAFHQFHPSGDSPSRWIGVEEWKTADWVMEREAIAWDKDHNTFLSATFPWSCGQDPLQLNIRTDEPHPLVGNGLHATLTIPMNLNPEGIGHLLIELNSYEHKEYKRCHALGSWCEHEGKLAFRVFIPNELYAPNVLDEICVAMSTRAIWVDEWFLAKKQAAANRPQ